jgi:hypothetical protein
MLIVHKHNKVQLEHKWESILQPFLKIKISPFEQNNKVDISIDIGVIGKRVAFLAKSRRILKVLWIRRNIKNQSA